jgi:hypothetical protein
MMLEEKQVVEVWSGTRMALGEEDDWLLMMEYRHR